jgi:dolichyl-phosphate-mannose-protein mannosyltransferase
MAASMAVFGDNGLGWRLPSVLAGMLSLVALFLLVRAGGESRWFGVLAVGLFSFDNLSLVHGRIGTLDMMVLAPLLLGAWLALERRWFAAGLLIGLGTLVKLTGLYGLAALFLWLAIEALIRWRAQRRLDLAFVRPAGLLVAGFALAFGGGLTALDARFSSHKDPIEHVRHMVNYGTLLLRPDDVVGHCESADSAPWQWLVNDCQITYLRVDVTSRSDGEVVSKYAKIDFRGAMNPVLLAGLWLAFPMAAWLAWRRKHRVALWALVWAAASYLPFVALAIFQARITYIYYFLPVIPALAVAVAALLLRSGLPRLVSGTFLIAFLAAVAAYYPFRQIP